MATITYDSIQVTGVRYKKILSLKIEQCINEHGTAVIKGELDEATGREDCARLSETSVIQITTTAANQPKILFCGVVRSTALTYENDYLVLEMTLMSTSSLLDIQKRNRSFQNTAISHADVLKKVLGNTGELEVTVSDKAIDHMIVQYNETDWEFILRIASYLQACVVVDVISATPRITIGLPASSNSIDVFTPIGTSMLRVDAFHLGNVASTISAASSYQYGFIGDKYKIGNVITSSNATLVDGLLKCIYQYGPETLCKMTKRITNTQVAGRMVTGKVQEVKEDKVRVHLQGIDGSFDEASNFWFPYSTAYSSSDGSGFYCMPAKDDIVRVFFPSENEADAFAASSVNVSPQENPLYKSWKNGQGKEILLTPEGIRISCHGTNLYIDLNDDTGIHIHSDKNINVTSPKVIKIASDTCVEIEGKDEVLLHSGDSFIDILPDGISFGGKEMLIN